MNNNQKLGIIAGQGKLPLLLAKAAFSQERPVFVLGFDNITVPDKFQGFDYKSVRLGAIGTAFKYLKEAGVQDIVMAGGMRRPSFKELKPDFKGAALLAKIGAQAFGDDGLLRLLIQEIEKEGFTVLSVDQILSDILMPVGVQGHINPTQEQISDLSYAWSLAKSFGQYDVGQGVIVQQGLVLGIEAIEGTDQLIARTASLKREGIGGCLVKIRKPQQERRADLPTMGLETIKMAQKAGLSGIALEAGQGLVLDLAEMVTYANDHNLYIVGLNDAWIASHGRGTDD